MRLYHLFNFCISDFRCKLTNIFPFKFKSVRNSVPTRNDVRSPVTCSLRLPACSPMLTTALFSNAGAYGNPPQSKCPIVLLFPRISGSDHSSLKPVPLSIRFLNLGPLSPVPSESSPVQSLRRRGRNFRGGGGTLFPTHKLLYLRSCPL